MTKPIIVALDEYDQIKFDKVLDQLDPNLCMVKIEVYHLIHWAEILL